MSNRRTVGTWIVIFRLFKVDMFRGTGCAFACCVSFVLRLGYFLPPPAASTMGLGIPMAGKLEDSKFNF